MIETNISQKDARELLKNEEKFDFKDLFKIKTY